MYQIHFPFRWWLSYMDEEREVWFSFDLQWCKRAELGWETDRKVILGIYSHLILGYQKKNVMQKQGPLWALNDPCPCSWKVCLGGRVMHKGTHSFPLWKEPALTLQHIALMGFALPAVGTSGLLERAATIVPAGCHPGVRGPISLWHSCCPCRLTWTWYWCSVCG